MNNTDKNLKIAVITDIHHYSKKNGISGQAYDRMAKYNQKLHAESEEVIRACWDKLCKDLDTKIVLIHGDLTNNGGVDSHNEVRELLKELVNSGKVVYVTYSTHDYGNTGITQGYVGDSKVDIPAFKLQDIKHFYDEFGINQALAYDEDTGSYVVQLKEGYRLLALNDDFGVKNSGYTDKCMDWMKIQVAKAKAEKQYIFAMAHHPIIPPTPLYKIIGKKDMIEVPEIRINQLADMGVNLYLTGHSHINKIAYLFSPSGNLFYNISTSSLVGYPPTIRYIDINTKANTLCVKSELIDNVIGIDTELVLSDYIKNKFLGMIEDFIESAANNDFDRVKMIAQGISLSSEQIDRAQWIIRIFCKWLYKINYGKIIRWTRKETKLRLKDYNEERNKKVVPLIVSLLGNLYDGNPKYTPETLEYKLIMGTLSIVDSIIKCTPINLNKLLKVRTISELIEPLVYNDSLDNYNVTLPLDLLKARQSLPPKINYSPTFRSHKGIFIVPIVVISAIIFSPILLPIALVMYIKKKIRKSSLARKKVVK